MAVPTCDAVTNDDQPSRAQQDEPLGAPGDRRPIALVLVTCAAHVLLAGILWLTLWATVPRLFGWHPTVITGGSMMPNIQPGDIVVTKDAAGTEVVVGAVITFEDPGARAHLVTHRVVELLADGTVRTKGDANQSADSFTVRSSEVRGRAVLRIPAIGLPLLWMEQGRWQLVTGSLFGLALLTWVVLRLPL